MRGARRVAALVVLLTVALAVPATSAPALRASDGYWMLDAEGVVYAFGAAPTFAETRPTDHARPAVALAPTPMGRGYVILWADGSLSSHGDADFGDVRVPLEDGERPTPTGLGYYLVASDGGVFAFGDAVYHGSMGGQPLNAPVQGLIPTAGGGGYLLVARDGGIFAFGVATFSGSMGNVPLNQPIVGAVRSGAGYLMVAADGGIFAFGPTLFHGSLGGSPPTDPVVAVAALPETSEVVVGSIAFAAAVVGLGPADFAFAVDPSHGGWADALELIGDELATIEQGIPAELFALGWDVLLQEGEITVRQHATLLWSLDQARTLSERGFTARDLGAA
jgi:hypothetical protein